MNLRLSQERFVEWANVEMVFTTTNFDRMIRHYIEPQDKKLKLFAFIRHLIYNGFIKMQPCVDLEEASKCIYTIYKQSLNPQVNVLREIEFVNKPYRFVEQLPWTTQQLVNALGNPSFQDETERWQVVCGPNVYSIHDRDSAWWIASIEDNCQINNDIHAFNAYIENTNGGQEDVDVLSVLLQQSCSVHNF